MKNLTNFPEVGTSLKEKNDNTLGRAYAFALILSLLLTFGVGEMWAM